MSSTVNQINDLTQQECRWGFITSIDEDRLPPGLNEEIVRAISLKKGEPEFMMEWRLKAYRYWATPGTEARRAEVGQCEVSAHRLSGALLLFRAQAEEELKSLDEVDPEILEHLRQAGHSAA